ncbi:MAG: hypothetical protein GY898_20495 [Proteobacteria bacterium]|nr:hypothetical protein [Pseudomonadota bacterium]
MPVAGGALARYRGPGRDDVPRETVQFYNASGMAWSVSLNAFYAPVEWIATNRVQYVDGILYFDDACQTYSRDSEGRCSSLYAVEPFTQTQMWRSEPLVSNTDFVMVWDYIVTGYGFTDEADFVRILRRSDGVEVSKLWVETAPVSIELMSWTSDAGEPVVWVALYDDTAYSIAITGLASGNPKLRAI